MDPMNRVEPTPKDRGMVLAEERTELANKRTIVGARILMA
jgi:hypothetical protein